MDTDIKAVVFDLDGVIVSTDQLHYQAWKVIADKMGIPFDMETNSRLRGVGRMDSLNIILENYKGEELSQKKKERLADEKNKLYRNLLSSMTNADVADDLVEVLSYLREKGYRTALGSSSRNARFILEQIGLENAFDVIIDGNCIQRAKPDPEIFLKACGILNTLPGECLVIDDSEAGIRAGKTGGMKTAAIGDAVKYKTADYELHSLSDLMKIL